MILILSQCINNKLKHYFDFIYQSTTYRSKDYYSNYKEFLNVCKQSDTNNFFLHQWNQPLKMKIKNLSYPVSYLKNYHNPIYQRYLELLYYF